MTEIEAVEPSSAEAVMTPSRLKEALEAWNTHDADRVLEYMAPDCTYHASFGPELLGRTYSGREAVRRGVQTFFDRYPDGRFVGTEVFVAGDRGAAEWTFVATSRDGVAVEVSGADILDFESGLIKTKNAFRKVLEEG
jgi:ketosteroid isomerase-like protein